MTVRKEKQPVKGTRTVATSKTTTCQGIELENLDKGDRVFLRMLLSFRMY